MAVKWFNSLDTNSSQWPLHILIMQPEQCMKVCMYKYVNYYVHCTYYMGTTIYLMSTSVLDVIVTIVEKFHGQNNYCFPCRFFSWHIILWQPIFLTERLAAKVLDMTRKVLYEINLILFLFYRAQIKICPL